jgi:cytosine/adenosine deaminase-related metal-dependent hydrolase
MSYRKFQATQLFTGTQMLGDTAVLITDQNGKIGEIIDSRDAGEDIQKLEGILSPGFINCHCHLELSHMKGLIPEQTGLVDFVFKVVTERHFAEEEILEAIEKTETEMIVNGTVAVGDICNNLLTLPQKAKDRLAYYNFIETSGWLPSIAETRFERSNTFYKTFQQLQTKDRRLQTALSPHAPYSVSDALWNLMQPHFAGKTITIHNQETAFEDELFVQGKGDFTRMYELMKLDNSFFSPPGKSSLQSYFPRLSDADQVILVHNTFTTEEDIRFVQAERENVNWCLCINANQYIEKAVPPVDLMRKYNCSIVIGTDSLASNHSLSILDELKTIRRHFPAIPVNELLGWATCNGAKALQMDQQLGSFEKGKMPGVVLIEHLTDGEIDTETTVRRLL